MTTRSMTALGLVAFGLALASALSASAASAEFTRRMNAGKAHLENRNSTGAIEAFAAALKLEPKSTPALRNLARARMLADQNDEAVRLLLRARPLERDSATTAYLLGLAHLHQSRFEEAVPYLEDAVRLDPFTPALRFQLAIACQLTRKPDRALAQLRETVRLDPLHSSAQFKLATLAAQAGDRAEQERRQGEFQRLRKLFSDETRTPAALERCSHTQPETAPGPAPKPGSGIKVRFADATSTFLPDATARSASAVAVLHVGEKGDVTLVTVDKRGKTALLAFGAGAGASATRRPASPEFTSSGPIHQCLAGNFLDDVSPGIKYDPAIHGMDDVLLVGPTDLHLLKRTGPASFEDVTDIAGLAATTARRARWVDYEHDGDLDLLLATHTGLQLWQNNGDGRFTNVTAQAGLADTTSATDAAVVDLDANVAVDLVTTHDNQPSLVFMNQRAGHFARMPEPPGPWPNARHTLANDLDNDGHMDALLVAGNQALVLFGQRATRKELALDAGSDPAPMLLDFDNDGWLDLCLVGTTEAPTRGTVQLWRNTGDGNWTDASTTAGLDALTLPPLRDGLAADLDSDGDTDLLLVSREDQLHLLRNDGGNAHGQLKLRLVGTKTNPSGLGTRVEIRAGEFTVTRAVPALPIELGLGRARRLDSVQTIWANGVVDNQLDVTVKSQPMAIVEKNVATGSCPYLYAWDGRGFSFVTDLLGNAPLGLSLRRSEILPADPEEIVRIGPARALRTRRGAYELVVTEELREVLYLDDARLLAVDHAPDVELHSTDKLGPPPFGPSEIRVLRRPIVARQATGNDGIDRTEAMRALDGIFAPPGPPLPPPLRGQCEPMTLTMDFGSLDVTRPLVLALTGWIQYGDASANIASSQNRARPVIPPSLEAETSDGRWIPVEVVVGMPAGKTKTILCDLEGRLPTGGRRLRLTTTFELRWDRVALFERALESTTARHELPPSAAVLRFHGFSEIKARAPGHPQTPAYRRRSARPPWRTTPQGWCTRYGDVLDLVRTRDERLVILNAGDAVTLRFDAAALPPIPHGLERTFFFQSVGWDKDADHNVVEGDTVAPLPVAGGRDRAAELNTRWVEADRFSPR